MLSAFLTIKREWALLLPAYSVVVFLLAYFVYSALAIYGAPAFNEMRAITGMFLLVKRYMELNYSR